MILGVIIIAIMCGLGYRQYYLGKKNVSDISGLIIPLCYLGFRMTTSVMVKSNFFDDVLAGLFISSIYYMVFKSGKKKVS